MVFITWILVKFETFMICIEHLSAFGQKGQSLSVPDYSKLQFDSIHQVGIWLLRQLFVSKFIVNFFAFLDNQRCISVNRKGYVVTFCRDFSNDDFTFVSSPNNFKL